MHRIACLLVALSLSLPAVAAGPATPPLPNPTRGDVVLTQANSGNAAFARWVDRFRARARAEGIRDQVFDAAFQGVRYNDYVIEKDRNQAEFVKPLWDYLDLVVSDSRVRNGRDAYARHRRLLAQIEDAYGVDANVVAAVWGMESAYGERRGDIPVIEALATLAFDGRRGRFFEGQLIAALKILQAGDVAPRDFVGSWAGAMGHTQFIPTSFLAYAVDATGDGRRDIWSDNPADALASTAAYLRRFGWRRGQPWGVEVNLPRSFDYALAGKRVKKSPAEWAALGVRDVSGGSVPDHGPASILLPVGARGPAFMIFDNFRVIERYNAADAYVIGVGHLADRIAGGGPIRAGWPKGDRELARAERVELQRRLTARGFDTKGIDGAIGPNTRAAIRAWQRSKGLPADGRASFLVLRELR